MSLKEPNLKQLELIKRIEFSDEEWARDIIWLKRKDMVSFHSAQLEANELFRKVIEENELFSKKDEKFRIISTVNNLWEKPELKEEQWYEGEEKRKPCSAPFKTPVIMWDGTLSICCFDGLMNLNLGNIKEKSFKEMWYGEKANEIRLKMINNEFDKIITRKGTDKCNQCRGYDTPSISDLEIKEFLDGFVDSSSMTKLNNKND